VRIVDADSHFQEPFDWFERHFPDLAREIPPIPVREVLAEAIAGDAFSALPAEVRPDPFDLVAPEFRAAAVEAALADSPTELARQIRDAGMENPAGFEGRARREWADKHGIDVQVMVPTLGVNPYKSAKRMKRDDLAFAGLAAYNTWATGQVAGFADRLIPVCMVDLANVEWSLAEIRRMRAAGSRVVQIKGEPAGDKSLSHPDFERFWSEVVDLDMVLLIHVNGGRPLISSAWLNNGGHARDFMTMFRFANTQVAELPLMALLLRGVFERHPGLRLLIAELGTAWVPSFVEYMDASVRKGSGYKLPHLPSEYLQRQVRVTVLGAEDRVHPTLERSPEGVIVFATDYPHPEGMRDAIGLFDQRLGDVDVATRERFFGGSAAEFLGV
jgi:predicted TIM-barrel fold metal-dependent hydrolase